MTFAAILLGWRSGRFATSKVVFLKEVGVAAATAVLIDAFIVRVLLGPPLRALRGRWNWWAPAPLERLHQRFGPAEAEVITQPAVAAPPAGGRSG